MAHALRARRRSVRIAITIYDVARMALPLIGPARHEPLATRIPARHRRGASSLAVLALVLASARCSDSKAARSAPAPTPPIELRQATASMTALKGRSLYSQHAEEAIIRDFFKDRRNGFFLDVGCASPIENSNTYYLEKELGWSGIGVDALAEYGAAWRKKRPKSRFFNFFVSDHDEAVSPFYRSDLRGVSSYKKETVLRGPGAGGKIQELKVPTTTLTRLLDAEKVARVDLLSMDIEGAEPLALAGFDIRRFGVQLACVEVKPDVREAIAKYFAAHGYERIERYLAVDQVNYYFAPASIASR